MNAQDANSRLNPLTIAVLACALIAGVLAVFFVSRDNNNASLAVVTTPTPPAVAGTTPCDGVTFGTQLQPLNAPSDLHKYSAAPAMTINTAKLYQAKITTSKGDITVCLQPGLAPLSVNNFVTLARNGFYDGLKFHRVLPGQIIQGGDPKGDGTGGPGYQFADEPVQGKYVAGAIAMANSGPNTNGSQFFIDTGDDSAVFQPLYNLFGHVESGLSVAQKIVQGDTITYVLVYEQK